VILFALRVSGIAAETVAVAQSPAQRCIPREQGEHLVRYFLPTIVDTIGRRCRPQLGANAFLQGAERSLLPRLRSEAVGAWPLAKAALPAISPTQLPDFLTDEALQMAAEAVVAAQTAEAIPLGDCAQADRVVAALSPLPSQNMAQLVTVMIEIAGENVEGMPVGICPAPTR